MRPTVAIVRGKFLNAYEMQFFEPLVKSYALTGFGSLTCYHKNFSFPVIRLPSPMDVPDVPYKLPVLNRIFTDAHYLYGLENMLRGFDLVHTAETYFSYTQQCLNAKKRGWVKKVIATVLENIPFNNEGIHGRTEFKQRAFTELDHIIALTNKTKDALLKEGADGKKITVIHHYVDTKRFMPKDAVVRRRLSPNKKFFTILFAGRLEEYKGVFDVLSCMKLIRKDSDLRGYDIQMIFSGNGTELTRMKLAEKDLGISSIVSHIRTAYDQMPSVYDRADIFIAPSKPRIVMKHGVATITYEEQYCTALLEAQAAGLPIVTTKSGGIPENVGTAAMLVQPGDVQAMARAIKTYITRPKIRSEFSLRARKRASSVHDIRIGARKLKTLYTSILS